LNSQLRVSKPKTVIEDRSDRLDCAHTRLSGFNKADNQERFNGLKILKANQKILLKYLKSPTHHMTFKRSVSFVPISVD